MRENAGQLIDRHSMVWIRRLRAPVEQAWQTVSTSHGLSQWWIVPPTELELRPGGAFRHHWENTVLEFKENEFIEFDSMRFELRSDRDGTVFSFIDTWADDAVAPGEGPGYEQPGGAGTPWVEVAACWHRAVDALETALTGQVFEYSFEDLRDYYAGYLKDMYRWMDMLDLKRRRQRER